MIIATNKCSVDNRNKGFLIPTKQIICFEDRLIFIATALCPCSHSPRSKPSRLCRRRLSQPTFGVWRHYIVCCQRAPRPGLKQTTFQRRTTDVVCLKRSWQTLRITSASYHSSEAIWGIADDAPKRESVILSSLDIRAIEPCGQLKDNIATTQNSSASTLWR